VDSWVQPVPPEPLLLIHAVKDTRDSRSGSLALGKTKPSPVRQPQFNVEIERVHEPDPDALDRVVEILYRLMVEAADPRETQDSGAGLHTPAPCLSTEHEG